MSMEPAVECIHCGVVMTSWSVPSSPIRYFQCPFCQRTHSSHYGEVFKNRAGARMLATVARPAASKEIPMTRPDEARWAGIKSAANRWYARLEADEQRNATQVRAQRREQRPIPLNVPLAGPGCLDPLDSLEIDVDLDTAAVKTAPVPIPLRVAVVAAVGKRR
jgi:hypothetical protein